MPRYLKTKVEIAAHFDVSYQTIKDWSNKEWWPAPARRGWPTERLDSLVAAYRATTDSKGRAKPGNLAVNGSGNSNDLQVEKLQAEIDKLREEVRQKRHKNELNEQSVVDTDYVVQWANGNILRLKQRLQSFPDEFAIILPVEYRSQGRAEAQTFIHELLLEISSWQYSTDSTDDKPE